MIGDLVERCRRKARKSNVKRYTERKKTRDKYTASASDWTLHHLAIAPRLHEWNTKDSNSDILFFFSA